MTCLLQCACEYAGCRRLLRPGGLLVTIMTSHYRNAGGWNLAALTVALAEAAGLGYLQLLTALQGAVEGALQVCPAGSQHSSTGANAGTAGPVMSSRIPMSWSSVRPRRARPDWPVPTSGTPEARRRSRSGRVQQSAGVQRRGRDLPATVAHRARCCQRSPNTPSPSAPAPATWCSNPACSLTRSHDGWFEAVMIGLWRQGLQQLWLRAAVRSGLRRDFSGGTSQSMHLRGGHPVLERTGHGQRVGKRSQPLGRCRHCGLRPGRGCR